MQTPSAAELARSVQLSSPPESFHDDPYPTYRARIEPGDTPTRDRRIRFRGFKTLPARLGG